MTVSNQAARTRDADGRVPDQRLKQRAYDLTWHWRDDVSRLSWNTDQVTASSVTRACQRLVIRLKTEYACHTTDVVIIDCREVRT